MATTLAPARGACGFRFGGIEHDQLLRALQAELGVGPVFGATSGANQRHAGWGSDLVGGHVSVEHAAQDRTVIPKCKQRGGGLAAARRLCAHRPMNPSQECASHGTATPRRTEAKRVRLCRADTHVRRKMRVAKHYEIDSCQRWLRLRWRHICLLSIPFRPSAPGAGGRSTHALPGRPPESTRAAGCPRPLRSPGRRRSS